MLSQGIEWHLWEGWVLGLEVMGAIHLETRLDWKCPSRGGTLT